jgi:hypothetical protein
VALYIGGNTYTLVNGGLADFPIWASENRVKALRGDFDGNGYSDIALTGPSGWSAVPIARSRGDGTFFVTNAPLADFPGWAAHTSAKPVTGDFDGDGRDDIALVGVAWSTIRLAFGNHDGSFWVRTEPLSQFMSRSATAGVKPITGDFNGDGRDDIALVGVGSWTTIPMAFAIGNGQFTTTNRAIANFPAWSATAGVQVVSGDFDNDLRDDIALTGGSTWSTIPVAFSRGDGTFTVTNQGVATFPALAATPGAVALSGHDSR